MRLALLLFGCYSFGIAGKCIAQDAVPSDSSVVIKLADEAIAADGDEAIRNRELSRSFFAPAFLRGYTAPGVTAPEVNRYALYSRMGGKGWTAGQAYRREHPGSVAQIMHEYGYKEFEGAGAWSVGFEAGQFQPDAEAETSRSSLKYSCWHLATIQSADITAQLRQILPHETLNTVTLRVRITGYVSPLGRFGQLGLCERQLYASRVSDSGG
jgi:hypothetical protein